jgi:hypothetical protein
MSAMLQPLSLPRFKFIEGTPTVSVYYYLHGPKLPEKSVSKPLAKLYTTIQQIGLLMVGVVGFEPTTT